MTNQFNRTLNIMTLFTTAVFVLLCIFHVQFMELATTNYIINGVIIGTGLFGIGLCFYEMFRLLPEYNWLSAYIRGRRNIKLPPRILRQIALILQKRPCRIYADALSGLSELIAGLNLESTDVVASMQNGLSAPLSGMATAFTSSLLGLGASLIMGFLDHMVGIAHNAIYTELGDYLAEHTHTVDNDVPAQILPSIDLNTKKITAAVKNIEHNTASNI